MKSIYLLLLALLSSAGVAQARIVYVNAAATGANNGTSWANAYTDLSTALVNTLTNDSLWIAAGTYVPSNVGTRDAAFVFDQAKNLTLFGGFAGTETNVNQRNPTANPTILSGDRGAVGNNSDNCYNVVVFSAPATVFTRLNGLIIEQGNANGPQNGRVFSGGGFTVFGTNAPVVALTNCEIRNNTALFSGGFSQRTTGTLELYNCWIHDNNANSAYSCFGAGSGVINLVNTVIDARRDVSNSQVVMQVESSASILRMWYCTILLTATQSIFNGLLQGASADFNYSIVTGGAQPPINTNANTRQSIAINNTYVQFWGTAQASRVNINSTGFGGTYPFASPTGTTLASFTPLTCLGSVINRGQTATALAANIPGTPSTDILGNARLSADTADVGAVEHQGPRVPENLVLPRFTASNDTSVCALGSLAFTAPAITSANGPVSYVWRYELPNGNGTYNLSTNQTLNFTNIQPNDDGGKLYYTVTTPCGTYTSQDSLTVNVINGVIFPDTSLRFDTTVCNGTSVTFSGGFQVYTYSVGNVLWIREYFDTATNQTKRDTVATQPAVDGQSVYTYTELLDENTLPASGNGYRYFMSYVNACTTPGSFAFPVHNVTIVPNASFTLQLSQVGNALQASASPSACVLTWFLNGTQVATTDCNSDPNYLSFTPTQEGTYTVGVVTPCGTVIISNPVNFTFGSTGIGAAQLLPSLTVAPNPASDAVRVLGLAAPATYTLVNALGQTVQTGTAQPNTALVLDAALAPGVYSLQVQGYATQRLMIVR